MIMVTSEEAAKLAVVAAASILFVALLLLTNYDRQYWCRQTKPSLIWYSMCEVPSPTLGTSLIEYQLSLLIWYSLCEVPSPTLGTSHIEYHLSQQLNNFAYQLQKSKPIIAITNMMASNQQAAP